jgi:hypothetical protein
MLAHEVAPRIAAWLVGLVAGDEPEAMAGH